MSERQRLSSHRHRQPQPIEVPTGIAPGVPRGRDHLDTPPGLRFDKSIETTQAERGLLLLRGENGELEVRVARTNEKKDLPADSRYSTHVVNQVSTTRRPVRTMVRSDAEALDLSRSVFDLKLRAVMCTALTVGEELLGVLLEPVS